MRERDIHMNNDLIEILEESNLSPPEIIELLTNFDRDSIKEYALENLICDRCFGKLSLHTWVEDRGEYMGKPAFEEMFEWVCMGCGNVYPEE